jgi:hypothetical protein
MKALKLAVPLVACLLIVTWAQGKPKKSDVSAVFQNARYVYVEAVDGDILKPGLYPEDRQAISDVQDSIRAWNRYAIALNRAEADLVIVVRKARLAGAQLHGGISGGTRTQPGQPPNPDSSSSGPNIQGGRSTEVGAGGEVGPDVDLLRIYIQNDGKLTGTVWSREQDGGLDAPGVPLIAQLKAAVEHAYPQTASTKKP